jgi:uncharacterized membrane protein
LTSLPDRGTSAPRRVYVDWARGIAVLLMIQAHTTDAWTRASAKSTNLFRDVNVLSGFAAPLFLWLAGLALVLSAERVARREGSRSVAVETVCRRGLEIFILAFLFRLQAFTLSPGSHPVALFRVDILNIMGPAIVVAGILWGMSTRTWAIVASYAAAATLIAMATPIVRASATVDLLPTWVQWYMRPAGSAAPRSSCLAPTRRRDRACTPCRRSGPARRRGSRSAWGS